LQSEEPVCPAVKGHVGGEDKKSPGVSAVVDEDTVYGVYFHGLIIHPLPVIVSALLVLL
jgi:hypothetical protein